MKRGKAQGYHLPFFCPKDLDNATFYGVSNGKYIYKCKVCKRAFSDSEAIGASTENKQDEVGEEEMYAYSAPNDGESSSASALLDRKGAEAGGGSNISKKAQQNLRAAAIKLERARYISALKKIDRYGGGLDSPQFRPKTVMGGLLSLIFIGAMLGIIVMNVIKLAQGTRALASQGTIEINHRPGFFKAAGFIPVSNGSQMDFPVMNLHVQNNIIFFNVDNPPVQKIELIDNMHFNPSWDTHNPDPPTTRSIYTKVAVPYDSLSDPPFKGIHGSRDIDMETVWKASLPRFFNQDMESFQLLEMEANYLGEQFFPHDAWLFIRFNEDEMEAVLPYQLDVALVNAGEVDLKRGPDPLVNDWMNELTTVVKAPMTWDFRGNMRIPIKFNLLEMKSSISSIDQWRSMISSDTNTFLNWRFILYYTSNFNYTNPDHWLCIRTNSSGLKTIENFSGGWANVTRYAKAPKLTDTNLTIVSGSFNYNGPLPADLYIWNLQIIEKVKLLRVDGNVLTLERHSPVDFPVYSNQQTCASSILPIIQFASEVPEGWTCPMDWYFDAWCDCDCGTPDPSCAMCKNDYGCAGEYNQYNGELVVVGFPCETLLIPGDGYLRGYYGSTEQFLDATKYYPIGQCPADYLYDEMPNMMADGSIMCNAIAENYIFANTTTSNFIFTSIPRFPKYEFEALYNVGSQALNIDVMVYDDRYVEFEGAETYTLLDLDCYQQGTLQTLAYGLLVAPLKFGQTNVWFLPCNADKTLDTSRFLPPYGPYIIAETTLTRPYLSVTASSCPATQLIWEGDNIVDMSYGEQVVSIDGSPTSLELQYNQGTYGTLVNTALPGQSYLEVYTGNSSNMFGSIQECCGESFYALLGERVVVRVIDVDTQFVDGSWGEPSCGDFCEDGVSGYERLWLERPLISAFPAGAVIESSRGSYCGVDGCEFADLYALVADLKVERYPWEQPYNPTERASSSPPTELNVDVGLFVVPHRRNFSSFLDICTPPSGPPTNRDENGWRLLSDRMAYVTNCELNDPPDTRTLCEVINCTNLHRMPPTMGLKFDNILPLNERWVKPTDPAALLNTPEYYMDVSTVYYFGYDGLNLDIGRAFSANIMHDGDVNQYGQTKKFSGELNFMGRGNATDPEAALYPAPAPIFFMNLTLYADKQKTNSMIDVFYWGYRRFMGWNEETVDRFHNISFSWPGLGQLDLQPGYNYTFTGAVTIQPVYNVGPMGGTSLEYWINSTATSFTQVATDPNSNRAVVRLMLTFNREAGVLFNSTVFTFTDFISSVGSAVALLGIGLTLLGVWQNITGVYPDEEEEVANKEAEKAFKPPTTETTDSNLSNSDAIVN